MKVSLEEFEALLPVFFSGEISDEDRAIVELCREESTEYMKLYSDAEAAWESMSLLHEMEQFNSFEALRKVNGRIVATPTSLFVMLQRVAAILLLPLLVYSGMLTYQYICDHSNAEQAELIETVNCRYGMVSKFSLPDSTIVWLNSGSQLKFPHRFSGKKRKVEITGEAYFKVAHNAKKPFIVKARNLDVEVVGTEFNVINYSDEKSTEVILVTGKVNLLSEIGETPRTLGTLLPGYIAVFENESGKVEANKVCVDEYISWREGLLSFNDEPMGDVVKRLNRWFNAEIIISDKELNEYIYKATFSSESLDQVLNLLRLSAPINYRFDNQSRESGRPRVYLTKRTQC